jgi:DNA-binding Lrp family transcriptional regulator
MDERLSRGELVMYGILATQAPRLKGRPPKRFWLGSRRLADLAGVSQSTAARRTKKLEEYGHIRMFKDKRGLRTGYEFVSSAWWSAEKRDDGSVVVTGYSGVPRYAGKIVPEVERPVKMPKRLKQEAKSA